MIYMGAGTRKYEFFERIKLSECAFADGGDPFGNHKALHAGHIITPSVTGPVVGAGIVKRRFFRFEGDTCDRAGTGEDHFAVAVENGRYGTVLVAERCQVDGRLPADVTDAVAVRILVMPEKIILLGEPFAAVCTLKTGRFSVCGTGCRCAAVQNNAGVAAGFCDGDFKWVDVAVTIENNPEIILLAGVQAHLKIKIVAIVC